MHVLYVIIIVFSILHVFNFALLDSIVIFVMWQYYLKNQFMHFVVNHINVKASQFY